jgi:hypothetical protein
VGVAIAKMVETFREHADILAYERYFDDGAPRSAAR